MKVFSRHWKLLLLAHLVSLSCGLQRASAHPSGENDFVELEKVILEELKETGTPGAAVAVIVLTNKSGMTLSRTTGKAKELFLPLEPADAEKPKEKLPLTAADLAGFAGKYVNGPQTWEILARDNRLFLKDADAEYELTKTGAQKLSFGEKLENDVALVPGVDGKTEYIFTGLYSARRKP